MLQYEEHGDKVVSDAASLQEDCGLIPGLGLSVWNVHALPVSAWVLSGFFGNGRVLDCRRVLPPTVQKLSCKLKLKLH